MITLTIFKEHFAHLLQGAENDLDFDIKNDDTFCVWIKDPSETSVIVEYSDEVHAVFKEMGGARLVRENLRLICVNQDSDNDMQPGNATLKVMSLIAGQLVAQEISVDFLSSYDYDYFLVPEEQVDAFLEIVNEDFAINEESIHHFW